MSSIDPDGVHVSWHRNGEDDQVLIGLDGDDVRLAVAFPRTSHSANFVK
ncbi:hypothetical protein ACFQH2_11085 [Natronoarchaeum sp. GCM10025703]